MKSVRARAKTESLTSRKLDDNPAPEVTRAERTEDEKVHGFQQRRDLHGRQKTGGYVEIEEGE